MSCQALPWAPSSQAPLREGVPGLDSDKHGQNDIEMTPLLLNSIESQKKK